MSFTYKRTIRFSDTDAAGVVYFANVLSICHEAYEESLAVSGVNIKAFFSNQDVAIPIVNASVDFFRPMFCGDRIAIELLPKKISNSKFEIAYQIYADSDLIISAKGITKHVCIDPLSRNKVDIPAEITEWLNRYSDTESSL